MEPDEIRRDFGAASPDENMDNTSPSRAVFSRIALNLDKAGMEGLDKEHIDNIIYEASKGSKFFQNELKKERITNEKIKNMLKEVKIFEKRPDLPAIEQIVDQLLASLEKTRDLSRTIVHIDMDAFYANAEMLDRPDLKDEPMAVGGMSMLSTANYAARRFGVRAAMPGYIALKLCPQLVILPGNFDKYRRISEVVQSILKEYDPKFCPMSVDEAYLDITDYLAHHPTLSCEEAVFGMREKIFNATKLTASAGIAANTLLAKVCSNIRKPNGQYFLPRTREAIMEFIFELPIRKVPGIGKVTEKILNSLGILTCNDLFKRRSLLYLLFHDSANFPFFMATAIGIARTFFDADLPRKSMSVERTFRNLSEWEPLIEKCKHLAQALSEDLAKEQLEMKTLTLKYKTTSFEVKTRAFTFQKFVFSSEDIFPVARDLLKAEMPLALRLMGLRGSNLRVRKISEDPQADENYSQEGKKVQSNGNCLYTLPDYWKKMQEEKLTEEEIIPATFPDESLDSLSFHEDLFDVDFDAELLCDNEISTDKESTNLMSPKKGDGNDHSASPLPWFLEETSSARCPVCQQAFPWNESNASPHQQNLMMNEHIDICLNKQMVRNIQLSQEEKDACAKELRIQLKAAVEKSLSKKNRVKNHRICKK